MTPTAVPPLRPADIVTTIPDNLIFLESAAERHIAQLAIDDLANAQQISADNIQLAHIEAVRWRSPNLDCPPQARPTGETSGYRVILIAEQVVYQYHTDEDAEVRLCEAAPLQDVPGSVLILVDPVAAELVALAQRRLSRQFDLSTRRVHLVEVRSIVWPDNSLGCPSAGQTYTPAAIPGYRIVLSVADEEYIFHTDFESLIPCAAENEVLPPETTPEAEPGPTRQPQPPSP